MAPIKNLRDKLVLHPDDASRSYEHDFATASPFNSADVYTLKTINYSWNNHEPCQIMLQLVDDPKIDSSIFIMDTFLPTRGLTSRILELDLR